MALKTFLDLFTDHKQLWKKKKHILEKYDAIKMLR